MRNLYVRVITITRISVLLFIVLSLSGCGIFEYETKVLKDNSGSIKITGYIITNDLEDFDEEEFKKGIEESLSKLEKDITSVDTKYYRRVRPDWINAILGNEFEERAGAIIEYDFKDLDDLKGFLDYINEDILMEYTIEIDENEITSSSITIDTSKSDSVNIFTIKVPNLISSSEGEIKNNKFTWSDRESDTDIFTIYYNNEENYSYISYVIGGVALGVIGFVLWRKYYYWSFCSKWVVLLKSEPNTI